MKTYTKSEIALDYVQEMNKDTGNDLFVRVDDLLMEYNNLSGYTDKRHHQELMLIFNELSQSKDEKVN